MAQLLYLFKYDIKYNKIINYSILRRRKLYEKIKERSFNWS